MAHQAAHMATDDRYYLMLKGRSVGPLTPAQISRIYGEGLINRHSRIRREGQGNVQPLYRDSAVSRVVFGRQRLYQACRGAWEENKARPLVSVAVSIAAALFALMR